jgi:hypothetical protein
MANLMYVNVDDGLVKKIMFMIQAHLVAINYRHGLIRGKQIK